MSSAWSTWVRMWDLKEHPRSMAAVRVVLGVVLLWDLFQVWRLGLVVPLFGLEEYGGFSPTLRTAFPAPVATAMPQDELSAWLFWGGLVACSALFTAGLATRVALVGFVLLSAQWELQLPGASRAIESAIRIVCLVLAFSGSHRTASLDAWFRTGSWWGEGEHVSAWPRHLIVLQLVLMYWLAGLQKFGLAWSPAENFSALYLILQDPTLANANYAWLAGQPWYTLTQIGTAGTMVWEWSAPLLILAYWYRFTADRPGRLRAFVNRWQLHLVWAAIGVLFHVGIALTLELGIFPTAMLAFYFAFAHPDQLRAWITSSTRSRRLPSNTAR